MGSMGDYFYADALVYGMKWIDIYVDLPGIEPETVQCECTGIPFTYKPLRIEYYITKRFYFYLILTK